VKGRADIFGPSRGLISSKILREKRALFHDLIGVVFQIFHRIQKIRQKRNGDIPDVEN
jgi:hypothetical protein